MSDVRYQDPSGGKPSAIEIDQTLDGLDFPADRDEIIAHARQHDATNRIIGTLQELDDTTFENMNIMLRNLNM